MARTYDDTMFIDTFEHEYTWLNGFMRNVRRFPQRPAVIDPDQKKQWTYRELNAEANRLAHALKKDGVKKDDVVMAVLRNSPVFCTCYVSPRKIGGILLAANYNLAAGEMALLIDHNKPKIIIYSANIRDTMVQAENMAAWKPERFVLADNIEGYDLPEHHVLYEDYIADEADTEPERDFRPHIYDEVLRLCTSGTTALPKSVPLNDINEVLSAHDVIMHYPLRHDDVCLNMTPLFHRGGCHSGGQCPTFYAGATLVVMRAFKPQSALDWVEEYGITFMMGAPANLAMLARAQEHRKRKLSGLRGIITMGAPLSRNDCIRYMTVLTPHIFNGYGTTETFWNSFLRPDDLPDGAGSVGGSCIDDEVRVVRMIEGKKAEPDDMVPQDKKTVGEIIVFSPEKTTYSYYKNDALTAERFYKGWMYTGDTGVWDKNWFVTVLGRRDDMMVVSGENIYPTQIEDALNEYDRVKDCMVVSVPDKVRGEAVCAYVVPQDKNLTIRDLAAFCSTSPMLSAYKRPRYFALVESLPRTATGKKMHYALKERAPRDLESGILRKD
ncbi:MAG: acyl--CoA ligase [Treponema sp.]|nr:acyl--CoA ligase [Treponema sp.]